MMKWSLGKLSNGGGFVWTVVPAVALLGIFFSTKKAVMPRPEKFTRFEPRLWRYELPGGWVVLAGKADQDNDHLSIKMAKANDYWFHVKGLPGSHVVLQVPTGESPGNGTLKEAAAIAAWHSKKRESKQVAVSCTKAQYVSKPRGAKPGTVHIKKEKVLKVRPAIPQES